MDNFNEPTYAMLATHAIIALFGAIVHASNAHRNGTSKGPLDFLLLALMSSFSGVIFAFLALQFFDSSYITLAIAGCGGFLGVEGLTVVAVRLRDMLANFLK